MELKDFYYDLPQELIAQTPLAQRDHARLMVVNRKTKNIKHDIFANVEQYFPPKSCLVLNDSKVIPARLFGKRESGGKVEIFLLKKLSDGYCYETLMRPLKRLKLNECIVFEGGKLTGTIIDKEKRIIRFNTRQLSKHLDQIGHMPLPPYIKRTDRALDRKYYQTVYAHKEGSVASPTAGLHFTNRLLGGIKSKGHLVEKVTLHINYATFKPVEEEDITKHDMHWENYSITKKSVHSLVKVKSNERKVIAVGTTSCRVIETIKVGCNSDVSNISLKGSTNIFMYPGYKFSTTDMLITNFHLPHSTLLMLVYAFGGVKLMQKAYKEAIKQKYRFYSYGDAMIII